MNKLDLKQLIREEMQKEIFGRSRTKPKTVEDIADDLKVLFAIAYESGLESPGSYDDFEEEFWNNKKQDIIMRLDKHIK
tara:strand:+ start:220 stop:456 length:237 start_codon:yes stop_codon:yes gene_type:complete